MFRIALSAVLAFLLATAAGAAPKIPNSHKFGPNEDGQYWTITPHKDGTVDAVSTCKPSERQANPECRLVTTGTWRINAGMPCYTLPQWKNTERCWATK